MTMEPFEVFLPPRIRFGWESLDELGQIASNLGSRVLLVTGKTTLARLGIRDRIEQVLGEAGLEVAVFSDVEAEPTLSTVEKGRQLREDTGCDLVIGAGGGSALDVAKTIAGLARERAPVMDFFQGDPVTGPGLPFVAVPTTSGTGSEATRNSVLIDPETNVKKSIRSDHWITAFVLWDPQLTVHMTPALTAYTGMDALTQAIEALISRFANPMTDVLAREAISLLGANIVTACNKGDDRAAREKMALGSFLAGMAMSSARAGLVHGLGHPVGAVYGLPHGQVCGTLLPQIMEYNLTAAAGKLAQVAALLGLEVKDREEREAARLAVEKLRHMQSQLDIPASLAPAGLCTDDFDRIIDETLPSGSTRANPREVQAEDLHLLLQQHLAGNDQG